MKSKDIDITHFKTISEVYSFIDENSFEIERHWDFSNIWSKYLNKTIDENEKQICQWEIDCFMFDFKRNTLFSQVYSSNESDEKLSKYPDLNDYNPDMIMYVVSRAEDAKSPLLKARYYHLLWKSPSEIKNNIYANLAIEHYTIAIQEYCLLLKNDRKKQIQIGRLFETLVAISNEIKTDRTELKILTKLLLFEIPYLDFFVKHGILEEMLEYPKLYKPDDFKGTLDIFEKEINRVSKKVDDFNLVYYHIPTAIKIAIKTNSDIKKWYSEKGLAFLRLAFEETQEERYWIKQDYHAKAIEAFRSAGNTEKRKEVELLYAELKPKIKLPTIRQKFDQETIKYLEEYQDLIKNDTNNILKQTPQDVYRIISIGSFFPKYADVIKISENKNNSFLNFGTTIQFDNNKNIINPNDEKIKDIYETYGRLLNVRVLSYLHYIIIPGIKSGHLTFENLILFISENTWMGKPNIKYDLGGEETAINWIGLISPSIVEFFIQIQGWVNSKYYRPNLILCIDSLTLKMEGLFRDFCERQKIPTSVNRKKGMQEAYIHNVLENDDFKKYFNEDDLLFFNYLFSNEGGINLRNDIAHCFLQYKDYHLDKMLLLIAALLRLCKYDYKEIKNHQ
jgi:hypothetical protein